MAFPGPDRTKLLHGVDEPGAKQLDRWRCWSPVHVPRPETLIMGPRTGFTSGTSRWMGGEDTKKPTTEVKSCKKNTPKPKHPNDRLVARGWKRTRSANPNPNRLFDDRPNGQSTVIEIIWCATDLEMRHSMVQWMTATHLLGLQSHG